MVALSGSTKRDLIGVLVLINDVTMELTLGDVFKVSIGGFILPLLGLLGAEEIGGAGPGVPGAPGVCPGGSSYCDN